MEEPIQHKQSVFFDNIINANTTTAQVVVLAHMANCILIALFLCQLYYFVGFVRVLQTIQTIINYNDDFPSKRSVAIERIHCVFTKLLIDSDPTV